MMGGVVCLAATQQKKSEPVMSPGKLGLNFESAPVAPNRFGLSACSRVRDRHVLQNAMVGRLVAERKLVRRQSGLKITLTFDPKTGLPATATYNTPPVEETYTDWKESDGITLPRRITLKQEGRHFTDATITEIKLNQGLTADQIAKRP